MAKKPLGRDCTLSASTASSGSLVLLHDFVDVTINDECETAVLDVRGQETKVEQRVSRTFSIEANAKFRIGSTAATMLATAYDADIDVYVKVTNPSGYSFDDLMTIKKFGEGQPIGDFVDYSVTFAHANFDGSPVRTYS